MSLNDLSSAVSLTEKMLISAKNKDWEELATLESQRKELLKSIDNDYLEEQIKKLTQTESLEIEKAIRLIKAMDSEIEMIVTSAKKDTQAEIEKSKNSGKAIKAYQQIT